MGEDKAWNDELLRNPHAVTDKRTRVQRMFSAIAPSYDLNNRLHSLWMDQRWRKKAVRLADLKQTDAVIDVACGTGDLSIAFYERLLRLSGGKPGFLHTRSAPAELQPKTVVGVDFTYEMLPVARRKSSRYSFPWFSKESPNGHFTVACTFINGDALALPLADAFGDVVSIAFGIRNVIDPAAAIREFFRVLRPGGRVIILEFSLPTNPVLRGAYNFYFRKILPRTASLISGDRTGAYKYLPESVNTFIGREQMVAMMEEAGFAEVAHFPLTFGVCVCYRGVKR